MHTLKRYTNTEVTPMTQAQAHHAEPTNKRTIDHPTKFDPALRGLHALAMEYGNCQLRKSFVSFDYQDLRRKSEKEFYELTKTFSPDKFVFSCFQNWYKKSPSNTRNYYVGSYRKSLIANLILVSSKLDHGKLEELQILYPDFDFAVWELK